MEYLKKTALEGAGALSKNTPIHISFIENYISNDAF